VLYAFLKGKAKVKEKNSKTSLSLKKTTSFLKIDNKILRK